MLIANYSMPASYKHAKDKKSSCKHPMQHVHRKYLAGECVLKLSGHLKYSLRHNLTCCISFYETGHTLAEQGHIKLDAVTELI